MKAGQFVLISEGVRILDDGTGQCQGSGTKVRDTGFAGRTCVEAEPRHDQGPEHATVGGTVKLCKSNQQKTRRGREHQNRRLWQVRVVSANKCKVQKARYRLLRARCRSDEHRLEKQ